MRDQSSKLCSELEGSGQFWHGPVAYTEGGWSSSDASNALLEDFQQDRLEQDARSYVERNRNDVFFLKTDDWRSEHEYRFVVDTPGLTDHDLMTVSFGSAVRTVVLGEAVPTWQEAGARQVCEQRSIELRRMDWEALGGAPLPVRASPTPAPQ